VAVSFWTKGIAGFLALAAGPAHSHFLEDDFQRTEIGERRLEQIEANEGGEPQAIGTVIVREQETDEDKDAREPADDEMHFHRVCEI
jgi:hypothetical protein